MVHPIAITFPGPFELILLFLLLAVPAAIFLVLLRSFSRRQGQLPSAFPVLPVAEADGPGRYRITGVDRSSKSDKEMVVEAASAANAKVKAELDGLIVTTVSKLR